MELLSKKSARCLHCDGLTFADQLFCCNACEKLHTILNISESLLEKNGLLKKYAYLDQADFYNLYQHQHQDYNYLFYAEGLHCSSCVHLLEKMPEFYDGISSARVNFGSSTLSIQLKPGASLGQVAALIEELGYIPSPLTAHDDIQEKYTQENRIFLKRIAIAGACAGNIMLFVIPIYGGLTGELSTIFSWMSFILFLPILFYSAIPFYNGAWSSLKYKVINIDLPITIAMVSSFLLSTYNLIQENSEIYFDSTASFMFLILSARYLLKRTQQKYLSPTQMKSYFKDSKYFKKSSPELALADKVSWVLSPISALAKNDVLQITSGQTLPMDAELLSPKAFIDMSLFNGESLPRHYTQGMTLLAGTKLLSDTIEIRLTSNHDDSRMSHLLKQLDSAALKKTEFLTLTDKLAKQLIIIVFTLAGLFILGYSFINFQEAFNRSLALIVLACPCALAFGSPLTLGLALKKAQAKGILIKDGSVFERIRKIENVFFDKTGTLTFGQLSLIYTEPIFLSDTLKSKILNLESSSYHPIAFAIREKWKNIPSLPASNVHSEILGQGVRGAIDGKICEIRSLSESLHDTEFGVAYFEDGIQICSLFFSDIIREESKQTVEALNDRRINTFLLTGDKKFRALEVGLACGLKREQISYELFPEDKKSIIAKYKNTCMIGDGANDALALQSSDVGIALKGSVELSLTSADVHFTKGGLLPLLDLLSIANNAENVLRRNLGISLIYNTVGGTLALLGYINPLMAAILMPLSSAAIVLSSLWGFRK